MTTTTTSTFVSPERSVCDAVTRFLDAETATLCAIDPELRPVADGIRDLVLRGGKRLRPAFAYWAARAAAGPLRADTEERVVAATGALELLHAFALIHDDVMDDSPLRRGAPSAHAAFTALHVAAGWHGDATGFGRAAAILAGDLCLVWADRLLAGCGLPAGALVAARRVYDTMRVEVMAGQYLDVRAEAARLTDVATATRITRYKAASYTVQRPLQFGAALVGAGARGDLSAAWDDVGVPVGEAFQLRDDVIGVYGDPTRTGKPVGEDLRRGKATVLICLAFARATPRQRAVLDRWFGDPALPADKAAELVDVLTGTGARTELESLIEARLAAGLRALDAAAIEPDARAALRELAVAAARREY